MPEVDDAVIVLLVVGARLLVPLAIPKFPLPAGIAAIVADFVDGTTAYDAFANVGLRGDGHNLIVLRWTEQEKEICSA